MATQNGILEMKDSLVVGHTTEGEKIHASLLRFTRYLAVFEVYDPSPTLRSSEVLTDFKIVLRGRAIYSGHAVVRSLVNAGLMSICEVTLTENSWIEVDFASGIIGKNRLHNEFNEFVRDWQKFYLVNHDYKVVIADVQTFLSELRLWLEQVEAGIRSSPAADRVKLESEIAQGLRGHVTAALTNMFERFEAVSDQIDEDLQPAHRAFGQRQLHPYLLCAPFIYRTYTKPLGYAGDYEMMNMIVRNELEGNSLYAKLINAYILDQTPAHAVRNRVGLLCDKITDETNRIARLGRSANIYSIACGPAREVENFLAGSPLADRAQFRLLDFNEETLRYTGNIMDEIRKKHHRRTPVNLVKNSVQNLLRGSGKSAAGEAEYDLIYCSGLYDYLNNRVIKALNTHLYDQLLPGGALVVGNFAPWTPIRAFQEHVTEWFLIYRDGKQLAALAPEQAAKDNCKITAEPTGTNIFLEIRKPNE